MAIFSKPKSVSYTCYELGHTWTPSCTQASFDIFSSVFREGLKIYGSLYLVAAVFGRRGLKEWLKRYIPDVLRSSVFLAVNGSVFIFCFCLWRCVLGKSYFLSAGFLPTVIASFAAILLERKSRRGMLAMYVSNVAVDALYRMLLARGIVKPIKYGEVLLFSLSSAVYMYLFRSPGGLSESTMRVLKVIAGQDEIPRPMFPAPPTHNTENSPPLANGITPHHPSLPYNVWQHKSLTKLRSLVSFICNLAKHEMCSHQHSCAAYVSQGFLKSFGLGYLINGSIRLASSLGRIFSKPSLLLHSLFNKDNFYLGAFIGSYSALFRLVNCLLRWLRDRDDPIHGLIAGFVAGSSMLWYRSGTLALYVTSKLAESLYFKGIESNIVPYIRWADVLLFSVSTAVIFHTAVFEPQNLRPAYWRFLNNVTDGRFRLMNRHLLTGFGTDAAQLCPDFWPNYDPKLTHLARS